MGKCPAKGCKWEGNHDKFMKHYAKQHFTPKKARSKVTTFKKPAFAITKRK